MFNFKKAGIYQALKWEGAFRALVVFKKILLFLFVLVFTLFLYGFFFSSFSNPTLSLLLGLSVISLTLIVLYRVKEFFFNSKLRNPVLKASIKEALVSPEEYNLAEFLSFGAAKAVFKSQKSSTSILYNLLNDNPQLNFIFSRLLLNIKEIKKTLKELKEPEGEVGEVILDSLKIAQKQGHLRVSVGDLITALAENDPVLERILVNAGLKPQDVANLVWWLESLEKRIEERKRFWDWKNLVKKGSLAKQWASGYSITLDKFSVDFSELAKKRGFPEIIGHQKETEAVERILARQEINNCLLVGEPGVGRKSIISALAERSVLGESLPGVNYKRVVQLDLPSLAAQTSTVAEAEAILDRIFQEAVRAGNIILVIDEFHNFLGGRERPGVIDISGLLGPYLNLPQFQIVAMTTFAGLHRYIEQKPSILSLFEKVEVSEVSEQEALMILGNSVLQLEARYKRFVSFPALRTIISLSKNYLAAVPLPKSAMDLLDEVMVYISSTKDKILLPEHVTRIVSEKTEIPIGEMGAKEKEVLLNLEDLLHKRIINQEEAVKEVSASLRRARSEIQARKGPMGGFLFLGPTGVGKTETAKALAAIYFGSESKMIRLDMSEFQSVADIPRLLGSPGEEGLLTTEVRENPFSLILLDELEKAHPNILNLFLQVLDEGYVTDGLGRKVNFKNSIIIATSNAGYQIILKALKGKGGWLKVKQDLLDFLFEEGIFRPEFINRFDAVVVFKPLSKENLLDIAELMLRGLKKNLKEKGIAFKITLPLKEKIAELGYDPTFGARQMRRVIQDKVENVLASALLSGQLKRGDKVEIDPQEFKLVKE